jgi:hypothetical protein
MAGLDPAIQIFPRCLPRGLASEEAEQLGSIMPHPSVASLPIALCLLLLRVFSPLFTNPLLANYQGATA